LTRFVLQEGSGEGAAFIVIAEVDADSVGFNKDDYEGVFTHWKKCLYIGL
jgi:hypothetical protein